MYFVISAENVSSVQRFTTSMTMSVLKSTAEYGGESAKLFQKV